MTQSSSLSLGCCICKIVSRHLRILFDNDEKLSLSQLRWHLVPPTCTRKSLGDCTRVQLPQLEESPTQLQLLYRVAQIRFLRSGRTQPSAPQNEDRRAGSVSGRCVWCCCCRCTTVQRHGDDPASRYWRRESLQRHVRNSSASLEPPSDAQVTAVCNNNACMKSLGALKQVAPTECTIGPILLHANIIDPILQRCANKTRSAGSAGSVSASGSGAGPSVGDVSGSASGSGPMAGDVGGGGSATKSPATSKPRTNSPANPRTGSASKAPGNEAPLSPPALRL